MLSYAITDPSTLTFATLERDIARFAQKADIFLYRDKDNPNYAVDAKRVIEEAKTYPFEKILLHNEIDTALDLKADGVHLSSDNLQKIYEAKTKGLFVVVSIHSIEEAKTAQMLGADMVTFSPVFDTPGKGKAVGVEKLAQLVLTVKIPVIALGGILTQSQIDACKRAGAKGFASIRYFK